MSATKHLGRFSVSDVFVACANLALLTYALVSLEEPVVVLATLLLQFIAAAIFASSRQFTSAFITSGAFAVLVVSGVWVGTSVADRRMVRNLKLRVVDSKQGPVSGARVSFVPSQDCIDCHSHFAGEVAKTSRNGEAILARCFLVIDRASAFSSQTHVVVEKQLRVEVNGNDGVLVNLPFGRQLPLREDGFLSIDPVTIRLVEERGLKKG